MRQFKTILLLIFLIFSFLHANEIELTKSEKEWLEQNHTVKVRVGHWPPFMIIKDRSVKGIAIDYLEKIFQKYEINYEYVYEEDVSWSEALTYMKIRQKVDMVPSIKVTDDRKRYISFTDNYLFLPWVIFTRNDRGFVSGIDDLKGKNVASVKGFVIHDLIEKSYPEIKLDVIDGDDVIKRSMKKLASGEVDAFIENLTVGTYVIQNNALNNIKVAAPTPFGSHDLAMGVRSDWKELTTIINKNLKNISQEEKVETNNKWMPIRYEFGVSWNQIWFFGFLFLLISVIIILILRDNNKKLKRVLDSSIEGIVIFKDRKAISANEPLIKLFGYTEREAKGKDILDFIDEKSHKKTLNNLEGSNLPYEVDLVKKDGTVFPALVRGTNIGNGKRVSAVLDLTELKKAQNDLKELNENLEEKIRKQVKENREKDRLLFQQSKLAAMGEMINNIAHQWRQPLNEINSIVMTLDLELMKRNDKNEIYEQMLNGIEVQTKYMSETIDNFSRYFSPERTKTEFYYSETVDDALSILAQGFKSKNIEVKYDLKKDKVFEGFPSELVQVLIIILNNATDAFLEKNIENPEISIVVDDKITIEDNAGGIETEIMSRIFEPYFTTKHKAKGTGVGLYMAKMIIEDSMNGYINVVNTEKGAKFTVLL